MRAITKIDRPSVEIIDGRTTWKEEVAVVGHRGAGIVVDTSAGRPVAKRSQCQGPGADGFSGLR